MKKILLITPEFFQYYKYISDELCRQGCFVERFRDIPGTSTLVRGLSRLNKSFIKPATQKHLDKIIAKSKECQFDTVILIYGMTFSFSPQMIKKLKDALPCASFVLYLWDSVKNLPGSSDIIPLFDKVFSFDKGDCKNGISFLPLFYCDRYKGIADDRNDTEYFCAYVGTAHPQKLKHINDMSSLLSKRYPDQFIYHYIPSRLKYYYHKLKDSEYKDVKFSDLKTDKLSFERIAHVFSRSVCILDAPQSGQTGLTMRTIEALGAKRKLITTNQTIKDYDFYDPANIYVYTPGEEFDFESEFFNSPYNELPADIYEKYSLTHWVSSLLS